MRATTYSPVAKFLHWLVVALIAVNLAFGWLMPEAERTVPPNSLNNWHLSFGIVILAVIAIRFAWRSIVGPPLPAPGPRWQILAAEVTHGLLYALVFVLVACGWANAVAHNWTITLFGTVTLPPLLPAASWVRDLGELHEGVVWVLLTVVSLHVLAALGHHFVLRDNVLRRMLPERTVERR